MKRCLVLWVLLAVTALAQPDDLAARVVILANSRQPESVRLAEFYAEKRAVPPANIIALPLPEAETITWREFIDQVWQPLQDELLRRGWIEGTSSNLLDRLGRRRYAPTGNRISYLVVCRGVPLRIFNDPTLLEEKPVRKVAPELNKNEAAVDAELSLLAQGGHEIAAMVPNPLFANDRPPTLDTAMVVKVSRLDGPTWENARHLVTSALEAERTGLLGRYYVDLKGPHAEGDQWLEAAQKQLKELGFDGDADTGGGTFGAAARFDAPVLYFGWYAGNLNGPFAREGFAFPPGAVALHIHSFSAPTLRSADSGWCGPLVARGVAATVGNVFEPYLGLTHRPHFMLRALSEGKNFGDAVYYSLPALSWQAVAVGDPLYRPFKVSLEQQLQARDRLPPALAAYADLRRANLLVRQGKAGEARTLLQGVMRERPGLAVALGLAKLAAAQGDPAAVVAALGFAPALKTVRTEDWALLRQTAGLLAAHGARPAALQVYANLARAKAPAPDALKALLTEVRATADAAGDLKQSLEFARQLSELEPAAK
ncbi:MAG TPA: TIGR03790 family protein [Lacunisphaera sp.]